MLALASRPVIDRSPNHASECGIELFGVELALPRRRLKAGQHLFRAGQPMHALYRVHGGCLRSSMLSEDGRERANAFPMRGDLLGLDSLGLRSYSCDIVALDVAEVWEIPIARIDELSARHPGFREGLTAALTAEIRRSGQWMLGLCSYNAEQRVVAFLLDLAERQRALGYSAHDLTLRMTRADLGSFLALQLETVTRVLSRLATLGLIEVARRQVRLIDSAALRSLLAGKRSCH